MPVKKYLILLWERYFLSKIHHRRNTEITKSNASGSGFNNPQKSKSVDFSSIRAFRKSVNSGRFLPVRIIGKQPNIVNEIIPSPSNNIQVDIFMTPSRPFIADNQAEFKSCGENDTK